MQTIVLLGLVIVLCYAIQKMLDMWQAIKSIQNHPGYRTLLSQSTILANLLPPTTGITPGRNHIFLDKHKVFASVGWDIYASVSAWPKTKTTLVLADASAIKDVSMSRARFPKPVEQYGVLAFFGRNIVITEGDEWKKHRKISAPAFSDRNNIMVWDETIKIMTDLFENVWGQQDTITVDHCVDVTLPIALFVISAAGFGRKISWTDDSVLPAGHQLTFKCALNIVTTDVFLKLIVPSWALGLTKRLRKVKLAFDELQRYMSEMIQERRTSEKIERFDLFSSLLEASNEDETGAGLTESELIGNIFIFLVAGHETTAHTLAFTFALLALYQDEQETLYQHIKSVLTDRRIPTYEDMSHLTHSMAVFYETLRMFPPVTGIPKRSAEDTVLVASNAAGEKTTIPVPKGTNLVIDAPGLHYNPRYWSDPHTFNPSRFLGDWPRDAFVPFSVGARACLGRKFSETEGIAILTMLVSHYKIELKQEPQFSGETFEVTKSRILACKPGITITPIRIPLVFKRRN